MEFTDCEKAKELLGEVTAIQSDVSNYSDVEKIYHF